MATDTIMEITTMKFRLKTSTVLLCVAATLVAACGASADTEPEQAGEEASDEESESNENADSGADSDIPELDIDGPSDLRIAVFEAAGNNSYLQARMRAASETAEEIGADVTIFDAEWDPVEQNNQIQNALQSGRFNAFVIAALDGRQMCDIIHDAIDDGIPVAIINEPICGRAEESGDEVWEPRTLTFVGGQTADVYADWIQAIAEKEPDGGQVAVFTGPELGANAVNFDAQLDAGLGSEFEIVATQRTDYSTPQGFEVAQDTLQANPDLDIIISNFSGVTQGVLEAITQAGREGVRVYDFGGNEWAIDAVESDQLEMTVMMLPYQEMQRAIQALGEHASGNEVPRFIKLTLDESLPGTPFVTTDNVGEFEAGY